LSDGASVGCGSLVVVDIVEVCGTTVAGDDSTYVAWLTPPAEQLAQVVPLAAHASQVEHVLQESQTGA
jgi:hypothetical protein